MTTSTISTSGRTSRALGLRKLLNGAAAAALVVTSIPGVAQQAASTAPIVIDPSTAGPGGTKLDIAANATPIVKIATPNEGGTSHNKYSAFNVDARGLILNNSATITTTQLAGYIDGNANLKKSGPASLILNEVTGASASQLNGYLEVAGAPAQVVVANANGITCGGCGFINTPWATLTTGAPTIGADGKLSGFAVERGTIEVGGTGLDASGMRLDLFARAVRLNAGLYADSINVVAGAGDVARGTTPDGTITVTARTATGDAPVRFALDVAALGGMYAKSIRLIGTEAGLGVNVDGTLASLERGFELTSAGEILLGGKVTAATTAAVTGGGNVGVAGTLYGSDGAHVASGGTTTISGLVGAGGNVALSGANVAVPGTVAAGLARDGMLAGSGALAIDARGAATIGGQALAPGAVRIGAANTTIAGSVIGSGIDLTSGALALTGSARTAGTFNVQATSIVNAGLLQGGALTLRATTLDNRTGTLDARGALSADVSGAIDNATGVIQSGGAMRIAGGSLANDGGLVLALGGDRLDLTLGGALTSTDGTIGGNGDVSVKAASLALAGTKSVVTAAKALSVATGGAVAVGAGARIAAGGSLSLDTGALGIAAGGSVVGVGSGVSRVTVAGRVDNAGTIASNGVDLGVSAGDLRNTGTIVHAGGGTLSLTATNALSNAGGVASAGTLSAKAATIDGAGGSFDAANALTLAGTTVALGNARVIASGGAPLNVTATGALTAAKALIGGNDAVRLSGATINLSGSRVTALGALDLASAGVLTLGNGAIVAAGGPVDLRSGALLDASGATIESAALASLTGTRIVLDRGVLQADRFVLTAPELSLIGAKLRQTGSGDLVVRTTGTLDYSGAEIFAGGANFTLAGGVIRNRGGAILHSGNGLLSLTAGGALDNAGGRIATNGALALSAASLNNGDATITAARGGQITLGGALNNVGGSVATGAGLTLGAGAIDNARGEIATNGALALTAASLAGAGGRIVATGTGSALNLNVTGAITRAGLIGATGDVRLSAGTIAMVAGDRLTAGHALDARTTGAFAIGGGTVDAGDLVLRAGTTLATGAQGLILASRALALNGATIDLRGGAAQGVQSTVNGGDLLVNGGLLRGETLAIGLTGALDSGSGTIASNGAMTIGAASVVNGGGAIDSGNALTIVTNTLTNGGGSIVARGGAGLDLRVKQALANGGGTIGSTGRAAIDAGTIVNAGAIVGGANALRFNSLTNRGTVTGTTVALTGDTLVNTGGAIGSGDTLTFALGAVDNRSGTISGGGGGLVGRFTSLANDAGALGGAGDVSLTGTSIDNGSGTIAAGANLLIALSTLTNSTGGRIWAERDSNVTATTALTTAGSIAAARDLSVRTGVLSNTTGVLGAGRDLSITLTSGSPGRAVAGRELALVLPGDYTTAAGDNVSANGILRLDVAGSVTNAGALSGGTGVTINARGDITNAATGTIVAPTLALTAAGNFSNAGLVNGGNVAITAGTIVNTARIYGDTLTLIGRTSIANTGAAAVIASRGGLLDLRSDGGITNTLGSIYSLGDIAIGGIAAGTRAAELINASGRIEAAGDIDIAAGVVTNRRATFDHIEDVLSTADYKFELQNDPRSNKRNRFIRAYTSTVTETRITGDSGAGLIVGRDISVDADQIANFVSTISASGNLLLGAASVTNTAFTGLHTDSDIGETRHETRSCPLFGAFCTDWRVREREPYRAVDAQTLFTIPSTITAGGTLAIDARTIDNVIVAANGAPVSGFAATVGSAGGVAIGGAAGGIAASVSGAALTTKVTGVAPVSVDSQGVRVTANGVAAPDAGLISVLTGRATGSLTPPTLNLGGLFRFAAPTASFLVETDPAFTGYGQFLSSDYFIGRLGYDPTRVQRRLGDALYEQRLITDQLLATAGTARLNGYASNEDQYRALMDAGVTYAKRFDLALGVGLTAEQMSTLTSDIVLLVETVVQTPSGPQKVLAPRVYLTNVSSRDMTAGGAIIQGSDLNIRASGSLANAGVLRATNSTAITGGTILNTGTLALGDRGRVVASGDLINRGGTITGGDVALGAGRDLRIESVASTTRIATISTDDLVTRNNGASVDASGRLVLSAGGTLAVTGSQVTAGSDLLAYGGKGIVVGSALDTASGTFGGKQGKTRFTGTTSSTTNVGSELSAGGNVTIVTPGQLAVTGSTIDAGGALVADAGSIAITGAIDTAQMTRDSVTKSGGLLLSRKTTTHDSATTQSVLSSTLAGDTVQLTSSGDTRILGSNVVATNGVDIAAGGNVEIGTVATRDRTESSKSVKQTGISLSGAGLFAGVAKTSNASTTDSLTNTGSLIGTGSGDVRIASGKTLGITGSTVTAPGTVALRGQDIVITDATDTLNTTSASKASSAGLSIKLYENVSQAVNSVASLPGRATSGRGGAAQTGITAASETLRTVASVVNAVTNAAGISANLGVSKSSSSGTTTDTTPVGSTIAGGNVVASATNDLTIRGSSVTAPGDITLAAGRDINLLSGQNTSASTSKTSSSSAGIGASVGVGLAGNVNASASINFGTSRGSGSSTNVTQSNTLVDAGGTLTLTSGRDTTLAGAVAQGRDVNATIGRNLIVQSMQDTSSRSSSSGGVNVGVSFSPGSRSTGNPGGFGANGGVSIGNGSGNSAIVAEQSALLARGGSLDANVAGTTRLIGGTIAALDANGADSRNLRLVTGNLTVADIADTARSRDLSIGLSANVNDPFKKGVAGANAPVLDGSLASSNFAQTTRATVGGGSVTVGAAEGTAALAAANRDTSTTQVVTRDTRSGFTVYADKAAANELGALVSGDRNNSVILQGAHNLATRPFGIVEDAAAEVRAWGSTLGKPSTRTDSQLERLFDQFGSLVRPAAADIAARAATRETDFRADALAKGEDPVQIEIAVGRLKATGTFTELAKASRRDALENERYTVNKDAVSAISGQISAAADKPTGSPTATSPAAADDANTIVVTARRRNGSAPSGVPSLVHNGLGAIGGAYTGASPITQRIISGSIGVLSAGPVGYATGEVIGGIANAVAPGALAKLNDGINTIFVAGDSVLQRRDFAPVKAENDTRNNSNRTPDAVAGTGLVVSALPIAGNLRKLEGSAARAASNAAARLDAEAGTVVRELPGQAIPVTQAVNPNKLNHVFGNPLHQLDDLVAKFQGDQSAAFNAVQDAANSQLAAGRLSVASNGFIASAGPVVTVRGIAIQLSGGRVVNGKVLIGSFSAVIRSR